MADDIAKAALAGGLGINSGGGAITPDLGSSASNKGGNNSLGGFKFGNYYAAPNYTPWIIGAVVLGGIWYMTKGKKRR
ncbi:hypothetical protein [Marinomonas spartinae]|uniref:hypothetical protein n=1 Tax=Marinomonas spartinae TaxID=1792290 RepID=UPI0018F10F5D|nr:hypothetical protein [Marinomonas spartinae]MBJ7556558.1 hypothetical protein [Marinomonas spartinae]